MAFAAPVVRSVKPLRAFAQDYRAPHCFLHLNNVVVIGGPCTTSDQAASICVPCDVEGEACPDRGQCTFTINDCTCQADFWSDAECGDCVGVFVHDFEIVTVT